MSEIVRVIEATKPLKLDLRNPHYVQELIDLAKPEAAPDNDLRKTEG